MRDQYLRRQGQRPRPKPAEARPTSSSCNSCGKPLKPDGKVLWWMWHPTFVITIIEKSQIVIIGINKG